jgi:hypothetical protein
MDMSSWIAVGSLIIAAIAMFYTYVSNTKRYELASQYRHDLLEWFAETIEILINLRIGLNNASLIPKEKTESLARLSAKIELGRFYFPNTDKGDGYGGDKPLAYKGYRNLMLDYLVFSYEIFRRKDAKKYLHHAEALQKQFTSLAFEILDPRKHLRETKRYTKQMFSKELRYEDVIGQTDKDITAYLQKILGSANPSA